MTSILIPYPLDEKEEDLVDELLEALIGLRSFMGSEGYPDKTPAMAKADAVLEKAVAQ